MAQTTNSWGRIDPRQRHLLPLSKDALHEDWTWLPFGNGRSYGDSCHNDLGTLVQAPRHDTISAFDANTGIVRLGSGMLLADLLNFLANIQSKQQWFPPVVPGTRFVTLGGALANDVHGKNHSKMGTFGQHVRSFTLLRSDGSETTCSREVNAQLFNATIGGMGLTGFVREIELQLMVVPSHHISAQNTPFSGLHEFMELTEHVEREHHYSVAWVDSLATGKHLGRGIMITGDHAPFDGVTSYDHPRLSIPFTPPFPLVAGLPLRLFNTAYNWSKSRQRAKTIVTPQSFFFPLDAIGAWNRLYGPRGLYQHQCVVPYENAQSVIGELLTASQMAGAGSFLTVLKRFGAANSPGILSFPQPGYTLTLDFPNRGQKTAVLLQRLDEIVTAAGGRVNPYKDQRMSAQTFQSGFPHWERLEAHRDPSVSSNFWRRTTGLKIVTPPPLAPGPTRSTVNQSPKHSLQEKQVKTNSSKLKSPQTSGQK